jgi:hypothetical protein
MTGQDFRRAAAVILMAGLLAAGCSVGNQERKYRVFFGQTAQALAPGYSLPPESAYGPLWALVESFGWNSKDGSGETKAEMWTSGDFNGDTMTDFAYILVANTDGGRALYAFLSAETGYDALRLTDGFGEHMGLATREPGTYATAAADGAGPASPLNSLSFEAEYQAIDFFQFEGAASSFVWNDGRKALDRYWTSD